MEIFFYFIKNRELINYFLLALLTYFSLYLGLIISHYTEEELKPGLKYFFLLKIFLFLIFLNLFIRNIFNFVKEQIIYKINFIVTFSLLFFLGFYNYMHSKKFFKTFFLFFTKKITLKEFDLKINNKLEKFVDKNINNIFIINNFIYCLYAIILFEFRKSELIILISALLFFYSLSYASIIGFYLKELTLIEKIKIFLKNNYYFLIISSLLIVSQLF